MIGHLRKVWTGLCVALLVTMVVASSANAGVFGRFFRGSACGPGGCGPQASAQLNVEKQTVVYDQTVGVRQQFAPFDTPRLVPIRRVVPPSVNVELNVEAGAVPVNRSRQSKPTAPINTGAYLLKLKRYDKYDRGNEDLSIHLNPANESRWGGSAPLSTV